MRMMSVLQVVAIQQWPDKSNQHCSTGQAEGSLSQPAGTRRKYELTSTHTSPGCWCTLVLLTLDQLALQTGQSSQASHWLEGACPIIVCQGDEI